MKKVLIVEDNAEIRANLVEIIEEEFESQVELHQAADGITAIDAAQRVAPDLILLDIKLPEIDGFQVLEACRASPITANAIVIVLTAANDRANQTRINSLRRRGRIQAQIIKPFRLSYLVELVSKLLQL